MIVEVTANGKPVSGATVKVRNLNAMVIASGLTKAGSYTAKELGAGFYQVSVSYKGKEDIQGVIVNNEDETHKVELVK